MRLEFEDEELRKLYEEVSHRNPTTSQEVRKAYRKRVGILVAARDERDLYSMRSNRFEKLKGDRRGQHSLRINDQWRLIIRLESDDIGTKAVVVEVTDYH